MGRLETDNVDTRKDEVLQRELVRKEKALAEAAALLVLQKKFQALWEGEEKCEVICCCASK